MHNHAPSDYICPFCSLIQKNEYQYNQMLPSDIIHQTGLVTAVMATRKWQNNQGHVLIIPNQHFENIYELPVDIAKEVYKTAKAVALTMKDVYQCDGISLQQNNEPAGDQKIWHYHLHVIPRYVDDDFYNSIKEPFPVEQRAICAVKLRKALESTFQRLD